MTGMVASLVFVPMMLSTGVGAEVQRPLATVVVFGMACDTLLTMMALPTLYLLFGKEAQPVAPDPGHPAHNAVAVGTNGSGPRSGVPVLSGHQA